MLHSCSHNNGRYDGLRENTLVLFVQLFAIIFLCSALYWGLSEEKRHRGRVFCRKPPYDWLGKTKSIKSANIPQMIDYRFEFFLLRKKICLRESFLFWECISSYSLTLWYLLFERVLMFKTNWHLFGQNEKAFLVENFASCLQSCSCIRRSTQIYVLLWSGHLYVRIAIWNRKTAIKEHNNHFLPDSFAKISELDCWFYVFLTDEKTLDLESTTWPQQ